jgi:hypothetical protein
MPLEVRHVELPSVAKWRTKHRKRAVTKPKKKGEPSGHVAELDNFGGNPGPATPVQFVLSDGQIVGLYAVPGDAGPTDSITDKGGARIVHCDLELIFWGSQWQTATNPSAGNILAAVQTLLAGPYLAEMRQYGFQGITLRGATNFTTPNPPVNFKTSDVGDIVWSAIDQGIFPEPDDDGGRILYMVFMPTGTNGPASARGAHSDPSDYDFPFDIDYAWVGWIGPGTLDYTMDVFSHELVEALSDPESDAWRMTRNINGGGEIGDACNNTVDRVDNLLLQAYWSQKFRACALPFGPPPLPQEASDVSAVCRTQTHVDVFWIGADGSVQSAWWDQNANNGIWNAPFQISGPNSAVGSVAAVARAQQHLDLFWTALDGSIWSAWWDQNFNNGIWSAPFRIAGPGSGNAAGPSAASRVAEHIDVIWVAPDGSVWSAWWDQNVNNGAWNAPFSIAGPASAQGVPSIITRTRLHVDVFWVGLNGSVQSAWWDQNANNGAWNLPFAITGPGIAVDSVAAVSRTSQHIDLFWHSGDGSVWSAWWDQNSNGGAWNPAFTIAGPGAAASTTVSCVARQPEHLDVFWISLDGSVWSTWWDRNANRGAWNAPFRISVPGSGARGSAVTTSRTPGHIDVFWTGLDGSVQSVWWDQNVNNGAWNPQFAISPPARAAGTSSTFGLANGVAVSRLPYHLDLFWVGSDGSVQSAWWDQNANNGRWSPPFTIAGPGIAQPGSLTAFARVPEQLDLFWVGADGSVWSTWWNQSANNGAWNSPFTISGPGTAEPGSLSVVARLPFHLDVFWVGPDGAVHSAWWDANANNGFWNPPFAIAGPGSAAWGTIAAVSRLAEHIDVFWIGCDGSVQSAWWDQNANKGLWNSPFAIAGPGSAQPTTPAVVARLPYHLDLFWLGTDGSVQSAWWDNNVNRGFWNPPFVIAGPGSADPGSLSAVARLPYQLDVFWVGSDGSMQSTWWDQNYNRGIWNPPFAITGPGVVEPGSLSAVARLPYHLDVFWLGSDGSVQSAWWDQNVSNGAWNPHFTVSLPGRAAGLVPPLGLASGVAVARLPYHLDLFWVAADGSVTSTWWDQNANNGAWNPCFTIAGPGSAEPGSITALARLPNYLDVFWVASDGSVQSVWWDQNANNGAWNLPFTIAGPGSAEPGSLAAVARLEHRVDVFWISADGSVQSAWCDQNVNKGTWSPPFTIGGGGLAEPGSLTAIARVPNHLDVFWLASDGSVQSACWDQNANNGIWNPQFAVTAPGAAEPGSLAAVARLPYHLDLFWVAPDGSVQSAWWDRNINNGFWNPPFTIAGPGSAEPASLIAVARLSEHLDIFWVGSDGSVQSAWWDQNANNGLWNPPFRITAPGAAEPGSLSVVARLPYHLDLFWVGADGSVQSAWWDQNANNGAWNQQFMIAGSGAADGRKTIRRPAGMAVNRGLKHMDVFWPAADGSVLDQSWDGVWHSPTSIGIPIGSVPSGNGIVALGRGCRHIDLFWAASDGSIHNGSWHGIWHPPQAITGPKFIAKPGIISAVSRGLKSIDLFWPATDGSITSQRWDNVWQPPATVAPARSVLNGHALVAVTRGLAHVDLFWAGVDGSIYTSWWDGSWHPTGAITGPKLVPSGTSISVVSRGMEHIDAFWAATDGSILTQWWDGVWHSPTQIAPPKSIPKGHPITTLSRGLEHIDLFWISTGGSIHTTSWDGTWHAPVTIAGPKSAPAGATIAAVSRGLGHMDIFWASATGSIETRWWNGSWH